MIPLVKTITTSKLHHHPMIQRSYSPSIIAWKNCKEMCSSTFNSHMCHTLNLNPVQMNNTYTHQSTSKPLLMIFSFCQCWSEEDKAHLYLLAKGCLQCFLVFPKLINRSLKISFGAHKVEVLCMLTFHMKSGGELYKIRSTLDYAKLVSKPGADKCTKFL
jgi:hypothetical protein